MQSQASTMSFWSARKEPKATMQEHGRKMKKVYLLLQNIEADVAAEAVRCGQMLQKEVAALREQVAAAQAAMEQKTQQVSSLRKKQLLSSRCRSKADLLAKQIAAIDEAIEGVENKGQAEALVFGDNMMEIKEDFSNGMRARQEFGDRQCLELHEKVGRLASRSNAKVLALNARMLDCESTKPREASYSIKKERLRERFRKLERECTEKMKDSIVRTSRAMARAKENHAKLLKKSRLQLEDIVRKSASQSSQFKAQRTILAERKKEQDSANAYLCAEEAELIASIKKLSCKGATEVDVEGNRSNLESLRQVLLRREQVLLGAKKLFHFIQNQLLLQKVYVDTLCSMGDCRQSVLKRMVSKDVQEVASYCSIIHAHELASAELVYKICAGWRGPQDTKNLEERLQFVKLEAEELFYMLENLQKEVQTHLPKNSHSAQQKVYLSTVHVSLR